MTTPQAPIGSGFGFESTAKEVVSGIDLSGKTVFITGGYSGIGTETVRALVGAGARVIIGGRRPELAQETLADIIDKVEVVKLELSDPASIDACAAEVAGLTPKIDILITNAAIMACPLTRDARGYEAQFATNHLGHFHLAARLWPLVKAAGEGARVVALSSLGHKRSTVDLDDPNFERREYEKWDAYGQAKSANALFALHLDTLAQAHGARAFSVHPGGIQTNLSRFMTPEDFEMFSSRRAAGMRFKNAEQGAATTVWAATSPQLAGKGGVYCENCEIAAPTEEGITSDHGVMAHVCDRDAAAALWAASERLTGVTFAV